MASNPVREEIRSFLRTRRARITPDQAGLPDYGGLRKVAGLRREEVAALANISLDYYVRMEKGTLTGASDEVLAAVAAALQLSEAERRYFLALAGREPYRTSPQSQSSTGHAELPASIRQILDAVTDAPAWVRNERHDILGSNQLLEAVYSPVFAGPRPVNTIEFVFRSPAARTFFVDWDAVAASSVASLRLALGRSPGDAALRALVAELSAASGEFEQLWERHEVQFHRSGSKRMNHPVAGLLELDFESMELPEQTGLTLNVFTAPAGTATAARLTALRNSLRHQASAR